MWTLGDEYFRNEVKNRFTFLAGSPETVPEMTSEGIKIGLIAPFEKPSGRIAFTNARIITMDGNKVIEDGNIVIKDNKIIGKIDRVDIKAFKKSFDKPENPEIFNKDYTYKNENLKNYNITVWNKSNSNLSTGLSDHLAIDKNDNIWYEVNEELFF